MIGERSPKLRVFGGVTSFTLRTSLHPSGWIVICQPDMKPGGDRDSVGNNEREGERERERGEREREKESTEGVS